jgi:hypothetical protein
MLVLFDGIHRMDRMIFFLLLSCVSCLKVFFSFTSYGFDRGGRGGWRLRVDLDCQAADKDSRDEVILTLNLVRLTVAKAKSTTAN